MPGVSLSVRGFARGRREAPAASSTTAAPRSVASRTSASQALASAGTGATSTVPGTPVRAHECESGGPVGSVHQHQVGLRPSVTAL